jgi:hypothetical protein
MESAAISGLSTSPKAGSKTPAAIGNAMAAEIGNGECGCVVDAVADHGDSSPRVLEFGDLGRFVGGQDLGDYGVDA